MDCGEALLRRHLVEPRFISGELDGRWRLVKLESPYAFFGVTALDGHEFILRLDCTAYPLRAPTGTLWNLQGNTMLEFALWPRGGRCVEVFRTDWQNGSALYLPCDHITLAHHDAAWPRAWPSLLWRADIGITCYLKVVHDVLQDPNCTYVKPEGAAAHVA
ncbi:MAG: hypothetical protein JSR75_19820 [Proteobacteria bacterium]|nr:hypothetical protein [Pseudomonadota bacterium]